MGASSQTSEDTAELDVFELWSRIWRQRWLVVASSVAFGLIGVAYALLATPVYRAEVVVVEVRDDGMGGAAASVLNQLGGLATIVGVDLAGSDGGRNGKAVLESRRLTEEFIRLHVKLEQLIEEPGPQRTLWRGVEYFRSSVMKISEDQRSGKITVSIDWTDPETAALFANEYVALANETTRRRTLDEVTRNIKYLDEQIERTDVIELRRVMFSLIETETKRLMLANSRLEYSFAVIDPAVAPEQRFSPRRARVVIVMGLVGAILGALVALGRDAVTRYRRRVAA